jgi:hypothetical protein
MAPVESEGKAAFRAGDPRESNPYKALFARGGFHERFATWRSAMAWSRGWDIGQRVSRTESKDGADST